MQSPTIHRKSYVDQVSGLFKSWTFFAATVVALLAYSPLLFEFFAARWRQPHYQHFPFVLGAFGWLLWTRLASAEPRSELGGRFAGWRVSLVAGLAWLTLARATTANSPWLAYFSLILLVAALFIYLTQFVRVAGLWGIWLLLWLVLPLPLNRDQQLIESLQRLSSRASSFVLDACGVTHLMDGNALLLPGKQFFVDEACSGIVSVLSIVACAVIYGVWKRRTPLHIAALAVAGIGWAVVMNTFRISIIAIAYYYWDIDWSKGTPHELLSLCIFTVTFLMLISTDVLLEVCLAPIKLAWEQQASDAIPFGSSLVRLWDNVFSPRGDRAEWAGEVITMHRPANVTATPRQLSAAKLLIPLAAFALLGAWQFTLSEKSVAQVESLPTATEVLVERALACDADFLPSKFAGLQRGQFLPQERTRDDALGNFSRAYAYRNSGDEHFLVSFDFPYRGGWHELTVCYRGIGWRLEDRRSNEANSMHGCSFWPHMEADFSKSDGSFAFLAACAFDEMGQPIDLPSYSFAEDAWRVLSARRDKLEPRVAFQVQVWSTAPRPFDDQQRATARALLFGARDRFRQQISAPVAVTTSGDVEVQ